MTGVNTKGAQAENHSPPNPLSYLGFTEGGHGNHYTAAIVDLTLCRWSCGTFIVDAGWRDMVCRKVVCRQFELSNVDIQDSFPMLQSHMQPSNLDLHTSLRASGTNSSLAA